MKTFLNFILIWSILLFSTITFGQATNADAQYIGNGNLLINPSFENGKKAWTLGTSNTLTPNTTAANVADLATSAAITTSATVVFNVSQTVNTLAGLQYTQGELRVNLKVPTGITDLQICALVDAAEVTCINTVNNNIYREYNIPFIFGATSAGIKFKTTATYASGAQTFYADKASLKTGLLALGQLQLDNVYSFRGSSAGVVSLENKDFVNGNGVITSTSVYTYTFVTSSFSVAPNCTCTVDRTGIGSNAICGVDSSSATQVVVETKIPGTGAFAAGHQVVCEKSSIDYNSASSSVYSQASANFSGRADGVISIGAVTTPPTKGTIVTDRWISARFGNRLVADGQYDQTASGGAGGSGDYLMTLPGGLSFDSNHVFFYTGNLETGAVGTPAKSVVGTGTFYSGSSGSYHGIISLIAYDATRFRVLLLYGNGDDSAVNTTSWGSGGVFSLANIVGINFHVDAPISGWTNASQIIGNFQALSDIATITYTVANNTSGGTSTSVTWNDRPLNTINSDTNSIITSLSANAFTLPAGTYYITATGEQNNGNRGRIRLRNTTDSTTDIIGVSCSDETVAAATCVLAGQITITASKTFKIQHWVDTGVATTGLGRAVNTGESEVHTVVTIRKIR